MNMVCNNHYIADPVCGVNASGSVAEEQALNSEIFQNPHRESNFLRSITFIKMKPALHGDNFFLTEITVNEFSFVTGNCRDREIRDIAIINFNTVFNFCSQSAKSCTKN